MDEINFIVVEDSFFKYFSFQNIFGAIKNVINNSIQ